MKYGWYIGDHKFASRFRQLSEKRRKKAAKGWYIAGPEIFRCFKEVPEERVPLQLPRKLRKKIAKRKQSRIVRAGPTTGRTLTSEEIKGVEDRLRREGRLN
jgi:hypothetical protein